MLIYPLIWNYCCFDAIEADSTVYVYICSVQLIDAYEERTMATASLRTLSPKSKAYRSTSTFSSLKIASTVTETQRREKTLKSKRHTNTVYSRRGAQKGLKQKDTAVCECMALPTWVCCWNDGPKEEAVSEVKISPKLAHNFHEGHNAIHDQPGRKEGCTSHKKTGTASPFNNLIKLN